ncbi:hypothetical protein MaudMau93_008076, partial [Microsporum audouinii]
QIDLYFAANATRIANETDKVLAASTFLEGTAIDWFEPNLRAWFNEPRDEIDDEIIDIFEHYETFVSKLKLTFGDIDEKGNAA